MPFNDLSPTMQDLLLLQWQQNAKIFILGFLFIISFMYVFYFFKKQQPTKIFFLAGIRFVLYVLSYFYVWVFLLIFPILIHPQVAPDTLILFLTSAYMIIFSVMALLFIFNVTVWLPMLVISGGKLDVAHYKDKSLPNYMRGFEGAFKKIK